MKRRDAGSLLVIGMVIWALGTVYYGVRGARILETTQTRYWTAFFVSPLFSAGICVAILRMRKVEAGDWATAMLLLALPGMVGEAIVLSHLGKFMPRIQAASGGRYGAFLFATYALVLGIAAAVTLRAEWRRARALSG